MTGLRERLGWSQGELAERLGVSQSLVSKWESGRRDPGAGVLRVLRGLVEGGGRLGSYPSAPLDPAARREWVAWRNAGVRRLGSRSGPPKA
jgi:transcriptional regulator with XRE-family HTH domain